MQQYHWLAATARGAFLCGLLLLGWETPVFALTVQPNPPAAAYTNSVNFNFTNDVFSFVYQGSDGNLSYQYTPTANGTTNGAFYALTCTVNGTNTFTPSNYGGLSLWTGSTEIYPWSLGATFSFLSAQASGNTLTTKWQLAYGSNSITYTYQFQMTGRTLTIQAKELTGASGGLYLDRCENAVNPVTIRVPYLTMMNLLYVQGAFCSMYVDWENTSASTIYPLDSVFSATSLYYAQQALYLPHTDGTHTSVNETIYLTVSPSLPDVLPTVPNPQAPYAGLMSKYLMFDNWEAPFSSVNSQVQSLQSAGVTNIWVLVHNWQNGGYDNEYPNVLPADPSYGGNAGVSNISQTARSAGYLFGLHENYVDFYTNSASWNTSSVALNSDASLKTSWSNATTMIQSYEMKPTLAATYQGIFSPQIHTNFNTTACFLDVHSAANPSDKVDYDAKTANAGTFSQVLSSYRALFGSLRAAHQGPVSGEGDNHMLDVGYIDDVEAQINSGGKMPATAGSWLPLMVDFELTRLHNKTLTHGVGYYERFYADTNNNSQFLDFPLPNVLEYIASELAYGHGGFIPTPSRVFDYVATAKLEERHVMPAQALYANAMPVSIMYHDSTSNDEVSVSDYIRRYPTNYANQSDDKYLSQVRVTYNNGVVVCVNRHPSRQWLVQLGQPGGCFNYNAVMNGTNVQWVGQTNLTSYLLPPTNGWVVFSPALPKISAITTANGTISLSVTNLLPGFSNDVEYATNLTAANWSVMNTFVSGGPQTNLFQVATDNWPQAFFRIVQLLQ